MTDFICYTKEVGKRMEEAVNFSIVISVVSDNQ